MWHKGNLTASEGSHGWRALEQLECHAGAPSIGSIGAKHGRGERRPGSTRTAIPQVRELLRAGD